jgi:hypothetical protein
LHKNALETSNIKGKRSKEREKIANSLYVHAKSTYRFVALVVSVYFYSTTFSYFYIHRVYSTFERMHKIVRERVWIASSGKKNVHVEEDTSERSKCVRFAPHK